MLKFQGMSRFPDDCNKKGQWWRIKVVNEVQKYFPFSFFKLFGRNAPKEVMPVHTDHFGPFLWA